VIPVDATLSGRATMQGVNDISGGLASAIVMQLVISIVVVVVVTVAVIWFVRRSLFGRSSGKQEQITQLQATGAKARAMITAVQPTGMIVNHIYLRSVVRFRLEPLDGSAPFDGETTIMLAQTNMPQIGDLWPAWYEPTNPQVFAVAQVNALTSDQIPMFREFGIPHPLDRGGTGAPPAP